MYEPTDAEYDYAEEFGWMVDGLAADRAPRAELTGHLFRSPTMTMCGLEMAVGTTVPATEHDTPCRECINTADMAAPAALVDGEVPM